MRDLRVMARHFLLLWVRTGEDELMWSCFVGVGGDVGRKERDGWRRIAQICQPYGKEQGLFKTWSRAISASCCNILASKVAFVFSFEYRCKAITKIFIPAPSARTCRCSRVSQDSSQKFPGQE